MNFIKEVRAFNESIAVNQLKPGHIAVWYALFNLSNKFQWQEWIPVPIMMLQLYTGLSEKAIRNDRNKLKQLGYIDFKTRGNSAPLYHINLLSGDESTGQSTGQATKKLIKDLIEECKASGLTYKEIQKALVMVDESLYHKTKF